MNSGFYASCLLADTLPLEPTLPAFFYIGYFKD
jgi:hypothetical protein